ncbi:hypothetical protein [Gordonia sp. OPL2]|uniref:hypothetical protein n=1 Tax=Gordonia sp. OPL2 TaxID=2486274 RepID=UPI001655D059|nr:hypothetical protein [Gordonia sp. OPL2]ROZ88952.1 hypothetical protein EEB19_19750 [Gordonia sp. OPL2]
MIRKSVAATALTVAATAAALAAPAVVGSATAAPLDSLLGSSGGSGSAGGSGSSDLLDTGSAALGSSGNKPQHFGKLGRPDAPNGVKSINVWTYAPKVTPVSPNVFPRNSRLGVRWNSTIDSGPVVDGNECGMQIRLDGPKVPKAAQLTKTRDCTAVKSFLLRAPGSYSITVTDGISGASNSIKFDVR